MSELKAVHAFDVYEAYTKTGDDDAAQVYLKSEADKFIADLEESHKMEVEQLLIEIYDLKKKLAVAQQVLRLNKLEALFSDLETMGRLNHEKDVVERRERHHKHKRCLTMADYCYTNVHCIMGHRLCGFSDRKKEWFERWHNRWLEFAEKFKPNNSTSQ